MNVVSYSAVTDFFCKAYTVDWCPEALSEDEMLRSVIKEMSAAGLSQLRKALVDTLLKNDEEIQDVLIQDFCCQTQPFVKFGSQYTHKGARQMLTHILSVIDNEAASMPRSLLFSEDKITEEDGTLVAKLNSEINDRMITYGRLFSMAPQLVEFLEEQINVALSAYEAAMEDAHHYNTNPNVSGRGNIYSWRDKTYPDAPEWVLSGIELLKKARGEPL